VNILQKLRKLEQARDLWKTTAEVTGQPIKEIHTGKDISAEDLSIDHFVPRSYISNDELWNLIPMRKSLNSSKNNKLPPLGNVFPSVCKISILPVRIDFHPGCRQTVTGIDQEI